MSSEPRLYRRNGKPTWWADFGVIGGLRQRKSLATASEASARKIAARMAEELERHESGKRVAKLIVIRPPESWRALVESPAGQAALSRMWKNAKSRATVARKTWALSWEDLNTMAMNSGGKCSVTGLAMALECEARDPFKASIDRIDNTIGYSMGNCRMTLMAVNLAMNVWGESVFRSIAMSYAARHLQDAAQIPAQAAGEVERRA